LPEDDVETEDKASGTAVETVAERHAMWDLVHQIINHDLTPRQRQALVGRFFESKPLVVLAGELGPDKDNIYKLIHDARKHLKQALRERDITEAEMLSAF